MDVFGTGDRAVRSLSLITGLAALGALVVVAHRMASARAAVLTAALALGSPFFLRYATESRMYTLVMLEVALGVLALDAALRAPDRRRLVAVGVLAAALPYTHYWGLHLVGAVAIVLVVTAVRTSGELRTAAWRAIVAVGAGVALWLPWSPVFRFQSDHTGTPWGDPPRWFDAVRAVFHRSTGSGSVAVVTSITAALLVVAAVAPLGRWRVAPVPTASTPARWTIGSRHVFSVAMLACVLAFVGATMSKSAYQPRYTSIVFPLLVLLAGIGLDRVSRRLRSGALVAGVVTAALWVAGTSMAIDQVGAGRTRAERFVAAMLPGARRGDVVVYCPDQLGPSMWRLLQRDPVGRTLAQVVYPTLGSAERVDWIDYRQRYDEASPRAVAAQIDRLANTHTVWLVVSVTYPPTQPACGALIRWLSARRTDRDVVVPDDPTWADHDVLWRFDRNPIG